MSITNEQIYERAMRMGIEGRHCPHEESWDRATKMLAKEAKHPRINMVGKTFTEYCADMLAKYARVHAMTYQSGTPEVVWFTDPSSVVFLEWAACGSLPVIK